MQASKLRKRVVVVGGGFGGIAAAKALAHAPVHVTLVDRSNHYLFQPLLYQVAMAGLAPERDRGAHSQRAAPRRQRARAAGRGDAGRSRGAPSASPASATRSSTTTWCSRRAP